MAPIGNPKHAVLRRWQSYGFVGFFFLDPGALLVIRNGRRRPAMDSPANMRGACTSSLPQTKSLLPQVGMRVHIPAGHLCCTLSYGVHDVPTARWLITFPAYMAVLWCK